MSTSRLVIKRSRVGDAQCGWVAETNILHLDVMGSHLVVLSSSDAAIDLLEQRSVVYGDKV